MDGLFEQLEKSGVGCHMGNHYMGCIGYAMIHFAALIMKPHYGIFRVRVLALFALHGEKRLDSCGG